MFEKRNHQYERMERAIGFLTENARSHPSLESLAQEMCQSEYHLQRTFTDWVGLSPKQFLQTLHRSQAKSLLAGSSVSNTAFELGYSSESRLYDAFLRYESITPAEYKKQGQGVAIKYGVALSPFGQCLIAWTERGICKISFLSKHPVSEIDDTSLVGKSVFGSVFREIESELFEEWCRAAFERDDCAAENLAKEVFRAPDPTQLGERPNIKLFVKGTVFQVKVWEALMAIPEGQVFSYQQVAEQLGSSKSVRAVASAIAKNPVAYLVPCHRVIRSTGEINQYRWGAERKASMLLSEVASANKNAVAT